MSQRRPRGGGLPGAPQGGPGGPAGNAGARGAILLAVAVVLGIVLLQQFDSGIDTGGQVSAEDTVPIEDLTTTTRRVGLTTVPQDTTTTVRARAKADVRVVVANGSGVRGLAGNTTNALKAAGWATLSPVDATGTVEKTAIQYADGYEAEARELAAGLSLPATVLARLASPPVAAADLADAKLLVLLGLDAPNLGTTSTTGAATAGTTTTVRR